MRDRLVDGALLLKQGFALEGRTDHRHPDITTLAFDEGLGGGNMGLDQDLDIID